MKSFIIGLLCVFSFFTKIHAQVTKEASPSWIIPISYPKSEINLKDVSEGTHILLYDTQVNVPKASVYYRLTTKVTDNVGIQNASTVNISYDPSYQKLKFHKINIIRGDEIINKLDLSNIQEMRRELNAENYLYDGTLSAVMNISDVRTGDIIDYDYTIVGFNPIHKNIFSSYFYLSDLESVSKINVTVLSKNELQFKSYNTAIKPTISKQNNLHVYNWAATNTKKLDYEENTPSWKLLYEAVSVTEFKSWKEVANWGASVFKINEAINPELKAKIDAINSDNQNVGDKIKATLNFVQNEVRYLGLESGIGSYKPFSPNQVFKQRFGDCKDKSLLMVTMLQNMGIEAYPMLVNTTLKHTIKTLLPSPKFFDHCVVKVIKDRASFYYDPTITNQGGDYDSTYFPEYAHGLVLKEGNETFEDIKPYAENKIVTFEDFTLSEIGKGAVLKVITTYYESEADNMRNYFKTNSVSSIEKEYEKFYSNYYYNVSTLKPPHFEDKIHQNIFKVYEEYQLDSIWAPMTEKEHYISASFTASSLLHSLYMPTKDERHAELDIVFPTTREHQIKVHLPEDWAITNDKIFVNSPGFYYEWKVDYDKLTKTINLNYYLKTQKDFIEPSEFSRYVKDIKKVDQSTAYYIYIPENFSKETFKVSSNNILSNFVTLFKIILGLFILVVIGLLFYWYSGKKKTNHL